MDTLYLWPDRPVLSLLVVWMLSAVFLWAARDPMLEMLRGLSRNLEKGFEAAAAWCLTAATNLRERSREALRAAGEIELRNRISRELLRIDASYSERLGQYSKLHRKVDDLIQHMEADYEACGDSPPEVPGWAGAVEAVSAIPDSADPNVKKVLEGIRESMQDAEKRALKTYKEDTARRQSVLGGMRPVWKEIRVLSARMADSVARVIQTSARIGRYLDEHEAFAADRESEARAANYSAIKPFRISLIVIGVALGGALINFQLIELPMSELVPAGARIGGIPVATVSALVIVLMETALGVFLMDMLGITDLFPNLATIAQSRRRLILGLSLAGLFFLAAVESSLAVLREQIVAADAVLKMSLAGGAGEVVASPAHSSVPVIGQAVLGFVLPWILAMVAIPLEMLVDSGRHVVAQLAVAVLVTLGNAVRILGHTLSSLAGALPGIYDVYVAVPLRIERMLQGARGGSGTRSRGGHSDTGERRAARAGAA
jgi:hypothetical protein